MKLIIDAMRKMGTERMCKYLHLGGGVGNKEDSLFKFKAGFSDSWHSFKIWKYIVNHEIYQLLDKKQKTQLNNEFFPEYRSN